MLSDAVTEILQDPDTSTKAQAAFERCRQKQGYDLIKQVNWMVKKCSPEKEEFCKMGRLAEADGESDPLLYQAQQWINIGQHEAAFQLVWACVEKASDVEERGNDSSSWEDWDARADGLLLAALGHHQDDWTSLDLQTIVEDMQQMQHSADGFGYVFFQESLPKLKSLAERG